ncbi:4-phosphopantetheinyl transferase [Streptomyces lunaelactis]|uniref:4-phosphopantetheinyl transferase n=1 Tax=Streptomyces lunaelactis TaxID=1535768 RepID=A0A2R4SW24_9ACTN|nr:4'-phosphopantetheinyl transferase superfamily protein [Streptomyces lunaelactis]AVZ71066.1 4-phosphopantetheinyl transferase [Streptomyces lunaelactis]NUK22649.1 4'-phosphopantetheinyl transferase superfamily protein [Streptomyces lunaelactis]NUK87037.1 4'-phosphopantetheinyl transferase superfamily protein [Streptomyces lunaelactis]
MTATCLSREVLTPRTYREDHLAELVQPTAEPRVWLVNLTIGTAEPDPLSLLDAKERAKATTFRSPLDRAHYTASHVALRRILGAHLGRAPQDVRLTQADCPVCDGGHGRPVVAGSSLQFSLSRRAGYCLIALARTSVGADLELAPAIEVADELATTLHPLERAALEMASPDKRAAAFARIWARKEAYLKGLGTGLALGASHDYVGEDAEVPNWRFYDVAAPAGLAAALAIKEPA